MSSDLLGPHSVRTARDLALVAEAARAARLAAARLTGLVARSAAAATAARWSSPSARAYGERADELRRDLAFAEALADDLVAALVRAQAAIGLRVVP